MRASKSYTTWQNIKYIIIQSFQDSKSLFVYYGIYAILTAIQPFIVILFPKFIIDELTGRQRPLTLILILLAMFLLSAGSGFFIAYLRSLKTTQVIKITFRFARRITEKNLTTAFINTENPVYLNKMENANRALSDVNNGLQGLFHQFFSLFSNLLALSGYLAIIASLNPFVLLFLILTVSVTYFLSFQAKKFAHSKHDEISQHDRRSAYAYQIMYDFAYGKELRIYNLAGRIARLYRMAKAKRLQIEQAIKYRYFMIGIVETILLLIREGVIYIYLIYLYINGGITIGSFMLYLATIAGFSGWMQSVINNIVHLRAQNLYINDLRSFLAIENDQEKKQTLPLPPSPYSIEFRNISFKYPDSADYIYKNFSLLIPAKQRLAIVGPNGAGKTTLIKLLGRLYQPEQGEILLNGINIERFAQQQYYSLLSTVFQEIKILAFSAAENIALAESEGINRERVQHCLEKAGLDKKIASLKKGINTAMLKFLDREGVELSGGEKQKLALARALYKNGGIVVLDEPTAALDALAESNIYNQFNHYFKDKTAIYISHRLASTRFCDQIALIENGVLGEYGTHQELMAGNGKYREMFALQAQYYQEEGGVNDEKLG